MHQALASLVHLGYMREPLRPAGLTSCLSNSVVFSDVRCPFFVSCCQPLRYFCHGMGNCGGHFRPEPIDRSLSRFTVL